MEEAQRVELFRAQTANVRDLEKAWLQINRQTNVLLRTGNLLAVSVNTRVLAVVYCALAEAAFSKIIHTPKGLDLDAIEQVKIAQGKYGVRAGWAKAFELALRDLSGGKSNHGPNVLRKANSLIEAYIFDPSLIRNKLAHGQWTIALNSANTSVNAELTTELGGLSISQLTRRKAALTSLGKILEDLIESPQKAHHKDYWNHLEEMDATQQRMLKWNLQDKITILRKKSLPHKS